MDSKDLPVLLLDVIVPTYNRAELLEKTIASLLTARVPPNLVRRILVVDNNSSDSTPDVVNRLAAEEPGVVIGLTESQQGKSAAMNRGIRASRADLIGFIDDDETVSADWYCAIEASMRDAEIGFIGGPVLGGWEIEAPAWLPAGFPAVLGVVDGGPVTKDYGPGFPGILMGGNCVIRRAVFESVGLYSTSLGRTASGLLSGEDHDMYVRLLRSGIRGRYIPTLRILHHIPKIRVTKGYYRSWCFWHAVSTGQRLRAQREPIAYFGGIPRYYLGNALRSLWALIVGGPTARGDLGNRLTRELDLWRVLGLLYGRYLYRAPRAKMEQRGDAD